MIDNETSYLVISKATSQSLLLYVGEKIASIGDIERGEDVGYRECLEADNENISCNSRSIFCCSFVFGISAYSKCKLG
jgi:hypothetical protein